MRPSRTPTEIPNAVWDKSRSIQKRLSAFPSACCPKQTCPPRHAVLLGFLTLCSDRSSFLWKLWTMFLSLWGNIRLNLALPSAYSPKRSNHMWWEPIVIRTKLNENQKDRSAPFATGELNAVGPEFLKIVKSNQHLYVQGFPGIFGRIPDALFA